MGKMVSFNGTAVGKVGANVFSVVAGQQIVRAYQPNVANPSTQAQVNSRARLKLMSQLAADIAPVIAIPKDGMVTKRNAFISKNYEKTTAVQGVAQVTYENVQITNGISFLPQIICTRTVDAGLTVALAAKPNADRVVYAIFSKDENQRLSLEASAVVTEAGENLNFQHNFGDIAGELVIYAYGMKDLNASAKGKYGNMVIASATDIARLVASRTLSSSDFSFTMTRGTTLASDGSSIEPVPEGSARVYATASYGGSVAGSNTYTIGQQATLTATPNSGFHFVGWYDQATGNALVSSANPFTFTVQAQTDLIGRFAPDSTGGDGGDDGGGGEGFE